MTSSDYSNYSSCEVPGFIVYDIIGTNIPDDIPFVIPTVTINGTTIIILGEINSFAMDLIVPPALAFSSLCVGYSI